MTHIRLETSNLVTQGYSGVSRYTALLKEALKRHADVTYSESQIKHEIVNRIYTKAASFSLAPALDRHKRKVDLTIFPNFATWPIVRSKKRAVVIHDLTYHKYPELVESKNLAYLQRVIPKSIKKSDLIITVSHSVKKEIQTLFQVDEKKIVVTPIPPSEDFLNRHNQSKIAEIKKKYSITYKKYIYFIGTMEPRKNLLSLIKAYRKLPQSIKNQYGLVIAGSPGWKDADTKNTLESALQAGENILHIGFVDQADSPALFQAASLFVMPSIYEGFGMPVLEAMASGCKVLANNIPVLREVGGDAVDYVDATNIEELTNSIQRSLTDAYDADAVAKNLARFSWKNNVHAIISALNYLK